MPSSFPGSPEPPRRGQPGGHHDALADIDGSPNARDWLAMMRDMWSGQPDKEERYSELFQALRIAPDERVLEVGCGVGGASRLLAKLTGGANPIVAVDPSRLAVEEARRMAAEASLGESVEFHVMDGRDLRFGDATFDVAFCSRVLVHARDPERILSEMIRVLKPGGRLLAVEPDRDGLISTAPRDEVNRLMWSRRRSLNPTIGRQLYVLFRRAGLVDVRVVPSFRTSTKPPGEAAIREVRDALEQRTGDYWRLVEDGLVDADALSEYARGLEEAARSGLYLRCDLEFSVFGTRPAASRVDRSDL